MLTKIWAVITAKLLTVKTFDLCLQGSLLLVILLEHNCFLLLARTSATFAIDSVMGDYAIMGVGGLEFLVGAFIAWLGRERRQLAISFWFTVTAVVGLIAIAFPFENDNAPLAQLCGFLPLPELSGFSTMLDAVRMDYDYLTASTYRTVFLIATLALCAMAKISIWAHGFTYLDDRAPEDGAYFYGILISIQLSLGLSGKTWLEPSANLQDWHVPQICICSLIIVFAILFQLYPRNNNKEDFEYNAMDEDDGFFQSLKRVLTNRTVVLQFGALGFLNIALLKFLQYDDLYAQARYHVDVLRTDLRNSGLLSSIFRPIVIIFFVMIFRMRFSVRRSDGVKANTAARVGAVVALFAAALFAAIAAIDCNPGQISGFSGGQYHSPVCSRECMCDIATHGFIPVCGLNLEVTYFSPCEAGCNITESLNEFLVFRGCSCDPVGVTRGACGLQRCYLHHTLYQTMVTLVLSIAGAAMLMQGMSLLRAVRNKEKVIAIGVMWAVIALTTDVLGHLLYFYINRATCLLFTQDRCMFHNETIYLMPVVSAVCAAFAAALSMCAALWRSSINT